MGETTGIAWAHHTFNPWVGCTKVSAACTNCYAEVNRFVQAQRRTGRELWGPKAERHVTSDDNWSKPLAWDRAAKAAGEVRRVFCASLADVFEDRPDLEAPRERLYGLIDATPHLVWMLLTKRPENAARLWKLASPTGLETLWQRNVWLGTTVEDQQRADERIPHLLAVPAAVRFISAEPLLGAIDLRNWFRTAPTVYGDREHLVIDNGTLRLHWVIVGGESGAHRRDLEIGAAEALVRQCRDAGVAVFMKQDSSAKSGARGRLSPGLWALKQFPAVAP